MNIKAVIFDLDGTITEPWFDFDAIKRRMGLDPDSGPVWETMQKMGPEQRETVEQILNHYENQAVQESRLNDGVAETLEILNQRGILLGVLTRNTNRNAQSVAKKHGLVFDGYFGRDDGPLKPDCFGVLNLCDQFGVAPEDCILVGDYLFDIMCAKSAGAIAVLLMSHHKNDEFRDQADFAIEKISQIIQIIDNE